MTDKIEEARDRGIRVKNTGVFKLKDKANRIFMPIHLKKAFGFVPEVIIVEKVRGENNKLVVRAVLTDEEVKKEDKRIKEREEKLMKKLEEEKLEVKKETNEKPDTKEEKK